MSKFIICTKIQTLCLSAGNNQRCPQRMCSCYVDKFGQFSDLLIYSSSGLKWATKRLGILLLIEMGECTYLLEMVYGFCSSAVDTGWTPLDWGYLHIAAGGYQPLDVWVDVAFADGNHWEWWGWSWSLRLLTLHHVESGDFGLPALTTAI